MGTDNEMEDNSCNDDRLTRAADAIDKSLAHAEEAWRALQPNGKIDQRITALETTSASVASVIKASQRVEYLEGLTNSHSATLAEHLERIAALELVDDTKNPDDVKDSLAVLRMLNELHGRVTTLEASFDGVVKHSLHSIQGSINNMIGGAFVEKAVHEKRCEELLNSNTMLHARVVMLENALAAGREAKEVDDPRKLYGQIAELSRDLAREKNAHAETKFELAEQHKENQRWQGEYENQIRKQAAKLDAIQDIFKC